MARNGSTGTVQARIGGDGDIKRGMVTGIDADGVIERRVDDHGPRFEERVIPAGRHLLESVPTFGVGYGRWER